MPPSDGFEALQSILDEGADINGRDQAGHTPLMRAVGGSAKAADKKRLVRAFLKAGADVTLRDPQGRSALDLAVFEGSLPLIRMLAGKGAGPDARDDEGRTALMKLNQTNSKVYKVVTLMVELGADPNAQCNRGRTPMMAAALSADHLGMSCFALQAVNARVDVKDNAGKTVVELCEVGNRSMLRMLHRNLAEQTGAENQMPDRGKPDAGGYLPPG